MTELSKKSTTSEIVDAGLRRRNSSETRFKTYGMAAIAIAMTFLASLLVTIAVTGSSALRQTVVMLEIDANAGDLGVTAQPSRADLEGADYNGLIKGALRAEFSDVRKRRDKRKLYALVSSGAEFELRDRILADPALVGTRFQFPALASDDVDMAVKSGLGHDSSGQKGRLKDRQVQWIQSLDRNGSIETQFNWTFFSGGDSREPELAGILGATVGSLLSLLVCLALSFPIGVLAAIYLEEFAAKNRMTDLIEVNINNLAAVPSIVYGLLGLAVFLNWAGLPRSAPLVGGMVLALMTLPTVIIAARAALKAVPPSIREAALGLGASTMQSVYHHVVPLAMPGILTGTIVGMARALGETAPLLMIGMVAFIADVPGGVTEPATALPVQIYLWADSAERAFVEKTAAAIVVLIAFLITMNMSAVWLRKRLEHRY